MTKRQIIEEMAVMMIEAMSTLEGEEFERFCAEASKTNAVVFRACFNFVQDARWAS